MSREFDYGKLGERETDYLPRKRGLGVRDADMPDFLEICFCCPCCCSAVRFEQGALSVRKTGETKERIEDYFAKLHAKL